MENVLFPAVFSPFYTFPVNFYTNKTCVCVGGGDALNVCHLIVEVTMRHYTYF